MRERLLRTFTALLLAASLGAAVIPGAAHAQSAGDEQYEDPLSGGDQGGGGGNDQSGSGGDSGSGQSGSGSGSGQSGSTGSGSGSGSAGTQSTTPPATTPDSGTASQLPRTGYPAALAALAGVALLGSGAALRRSASAER